MTVIAGITLFVLNTLWVLLIPLGLPGTWLIALTTGLIAWWRWDPLAPAAHQFIGIPTLILLVLLAIIGEFIEFFAGVAGARAGGASRTGAFAAVIGTLFGGVIGTFIIPIPLIGSLIGACGGAALATMLAEIAIGRTEQDAVRAGVGAGVGRLKGTLAKIAVGAMMWLLTAIAIFWP